LIRLAELDKLFMLLVPELVVLVVGAVTFPSEANSVQNSLSIRSNFVMDMMLLLRANALP
jgi:hypothetical protein